MAWWHAYVDELCGVGCIGVLMVDSGRKDVFKSSFGSVSQMLTGKSFPLNIRALRLVVDEIVHQFLLKAVI